MNLVNEVDPTFVVMKKRKNTNKIGKTKPTKEQQYIHGEDQVITSKRNETNSNNIKKD